MRTEQLIDSLENYESMLANLKADSVATIIVLSQGTLAGGAPYYAYLAVPPSKYEAFRIAEANGTLVLQEYGTILKFAREKEPSPEVKKEMEKNFGIQHNMETFSNED